MTSACQNLAFLLVLLALLFPTSANAGKTTFVKAKALYAEGNYVEALIFFSRLSKISADSNWRAYVDSELHIADIILKFDDPARASERLGNLVDTAEKSGNGFTKHELLVLNLKLASSYRGLGNYQAARESIEAALSLTTARSFMLAELQNEKGLIYLANGSEKLAKSQFEYAFTSAQREEKALLSAEIASNLAKLAIEEYDIDSIHIQLRQASMLAEKLETNGDSAFLFLTLGKLYAHAAEELDYGPQYVRLAFDHYSRAIEYAEDHNLLNIAAYGYGYIGLLYEEDERFTESLAYSKKAEELAQRIGDQQSLYQWQWLSARNLWELDRKNESGEKYAAAVENLRPIRARLLTAEGKSYGKLLGPLYYQYADYLLRSAVSETDTESRLRSLSSVRELLEEIKLAELQDYFKSDCNVQSSGSIDDISSGEDTLTLYPVLLEDRVEMLLSNGKVIKRYSSEISRKEITRMITKFRSEIQVNTGTREYLKLAQELYNFIIRPIEAEIDYSRANTLVLVPDGPLRTIPISALHDGEKFLVEKIAVAVTPGLTLTETSEATKAKGIFAGGLSQARQGFSELPAVEGELGMLEEELSAAVLKNDTFTEQAIAQGLSVENFSIAHFATHGNSALITVSHFCLPTMANLRWLNWSKA